MIERIATIKRTNEIISKYNFFFKKNYGQNFLIDSNIIENIAESAQITKDDYVIEIGPGIGSLTQVLAESAKKVIAIEIDKNLIPILEDTLSPYDNIEIINQDVLKLDLNEVIKEKCEDKPVKVVANLPYYITTPIVAALLEKRYKIKSITVMIQKEVADRFLADNKSKEYGAISLLINYYANTKLNMIVSANCFTPRPKVDSAVITLNLYDELPLKADDEKLFFEIIKLAFGQRRKTLLNCIFQKYNCYFSKQDIADILNSLGYDERIRGEALSISDFIKISDRFSELIALKK